MLSRTVRFFLMLIFLISAYSCVRPEKDSSRISLQLPTYQDVNSLTCTKCLMGVFVNVSGDFPLLRFNQRLEKMESTTLPALSGEVILDVPSGPARKIQVFAIYRLPSGFLEAQYGSIVADIFGIEPPPVTIALANLSTFKGGSLMGRYLTTATGGPTGRVIISLDHPIPGSTTTIKMDLFDTQMLNGWFEGFLSDNFKMSYRMAFDGAPLGGLQAVNLTNISPASGDQTRARFNRPSSFSVWNGAAWDAVTEHHDLVYGFFGDAVLVNTKKVCLDDADGVVLSNLSSNAISADITFSPGTSAANRIFGEGGVTYSTAGASCNSADTTQYLADRINIRRQQFNGFGNDTAKSLKSAFTYYFDGANAPKRYKRINSTTIDFTFYGLPGLFSVPNGTMPIFFDGAKLFNRTSTVNIENPICDKLWLTDNGFQEWIDFATAPAVPAADSVTFSLSTSQLSQVQSGRSVLCPTKQGELTGHIGYYVVDLN